jgi:hypothetical protein
VVAASLVGSIADAAGGDVSGEPALLQEIGLVCAQV